MDRIRTGPRLVTAALLLTLGLATGCDAVEELVTITLGEGDIEPVELDRTYDLIDIERTICPTGMYSIPDLSGETHTVNLMNVEGGCRIALPDVDVVIFDEEQARMTSNELDGFEVDGVRGARVHVTELVFSDGSGNPIEVPGTVSDFELTTDGEVLFTADELPDARAGTLEKELPMATVDRLKAAVEAETEARARLGLSITVASFEDLPQAVRIRLVVQPIVDVNVIDAVL